MPCSERKIIGVVDDYGKPVQGLKIVDKRSVFTEEFETEHVAGGGPRCFRVASAWTKKFKPIRRLVEKVRRNTASKSFINGIELQK